MHLNIVYGTIVVLAIIALYFINKEGSESLKIRADDGEYYQILQQYDSKQETAKLFSQINAKLLKFLEHLKYKYNVNSTNSSTVKQTRIQEIVERIVERYNFEQLKETIPTGMNGTSYTIDKGESVYMCMRDKDTLMLHKEHDIMFVALHELAHIGNVTWGHEADYWETFKFVLHEAKLAGLHEPTDYSKAPITYCGLFIDYNPYFDSGVASLQGIP
jgi:hypothetical protein